MLTLLSPTIIHTRFNDNWLFVSFFYYYYYFSLVFFYLLLFFIKWLYNDLLNFSFCKYIWSHPPSIYSKLMLLAGAFLFTLSIFLDKFLLVEIPGTKHLMYLVIADLLLKRLYVLDVYIYIYIYISTHNVCFSMNCFIFRSVVLVTVADLLK